MYHKIPNATRQPSRHFRTYPSPFPTAARRSLPSLLASLLPGFSASAITMPSLFFHCEGKLHNALIELWRRALSLSGDCRGEMYIGTVTEIVVLWCCTGWSSDWLVVASCSEGQDKRGQKGEEGKLP
ncbi:hypothetical protein DL98DRAFT_293007 [Cadophora sp. DSE1049]|nr:hypothetical protein DL98DRAFT_293007 [Cadophora sp. DSE1049]